MKRIQKIEYIALAAILVLAAVFGMMIGRTHTNLFTDFDSLDYCAVGELPDNSQLVDSFIDSLRQVTLREDVMSIRCTCISDPDYFYNSMRIKVKVLQVFQGEGVRAGDEIWISDDSWGIIALDPADDTARSYSPELGFVNLPKPDYEYLIFLDGPGTTAQYKYMPLFKIADSVITAIFCYSDMNHVIAEHSSTNTYVPYEAVKGNEYFVSSQSELDKLLQFKKEVLQRYKGGDSRVDDN